jgi:hypothetical protein
MFDIKFNITDRYNVTKTQIEKDKKNINLLRNEININNMKYYETFINKYYNVSYCGCTSKPLWMPDDIRCYRYNDMIQKFELDTYNINFINLLHQYV